MNHELPDLTAVESLVRRRRSSLVCDRDRDVPRDRRPAVPTGVRGAEPQAHRPVAGRGVHRRRPIPARVTLADDMSSAAPDAPDAKLDKTRTKYLRAPVDRRRRLPARRRARHATARTLFAVAAGVENLLLGATAAGLATLWSSPPVLGAARATSWPGSSRDRAGGRRLRRLARR